MSEQATTPPHANTASGAPFLLQMAGAPGSGKSTLARALSARYGAVVLDSDVIKTALLDADVPWGLAGHGGYSVLFALSHDLLASARSVIIDSPSHYEVIPIRGHAIAEGHNVPYRFIECVCNDPAELRRRLTSRTPRRSQMPDLDQLPPDADVPSPASRVGQHRWHTYGPDGGHLVVDCSAHPTQSLKLAIRYIEDAQPRDQRRSRP